MISSAAGITRIIDCLPKYNEDWQEGWLIERARNDGGETGGAKPKVTAAVTRGCYQMCAGGTQDGHRICAEAIREMAGNRLMRDPEEAEQPGEEAAVEGCVVRQR